MNLYDFQEDAKSMLREFIDNGKNVLLQSATGSGKTVIASTLIKDLIQEEKKVLCLLGLQALVPQFVQTLADIDIAASVSVLHDEMTKGKDGRKFVLDYNRPILISMPETFNNVISGQANKNLSFDSNWEPDVIVIDEAHKGTSNTYQRIVECYPNAVVVGLTATPKRARNKDGECLTEWYGDNLVITVSVQELIDRGILTKPEYFEFDENVKMVDVWKEHTENSSIKSTIIFTRDTRHSKAIEEAFLQSGISAKIVTAVEDEELGTTPMTPNQRMQLFNEFEAGEFDVLISVNALCEGFDSPRAKYCFIARTVGNISLYHQIIGRVLRRYIGKDKAIIADFGGNISKHGYIEDYDWGMAYGDEVTLNLKDGRVIGQSRFEEHNNIMIRCSCNHVYNAKKYDSCSHCGEASGLEILTVIGDIAERFFNIKHPVVYKNFLVRLKAAMAGKRVTEFYKYHDTEQKMMHIDGSLKSGFTFLNSMLEHGDKGMKKKIYIPR